MRAKDEEPKTSQNKGERFGKIILLTYIYCNILHTVPRLVNETVTGKIVYLCACVSVFVCVRSECERMRVSACMMCVRERERE
jgi:hypothetical protein